ncbi:DUF2280 domain-containing protein [Vibrio fluvialis]|uniref:DUF2280 domain-containing protein n=1 Tax=Vibrio fluvialis TaxID=676 RepID=UPI001EE9E3E9|nr:DUF2280 domain-containing protein [Vibrio fluvialis]MCG6366994.1 DUF2280 domain-containing protein [Vibrio fluvialis]MCG6375645.1 DUF2280 domain-containing protein [Vibrio fluvialis]
MAALNNEVKAFIVQALACYDSLETVSSSVKEQFGLSLTRQQIQSYDPTKAAGKSLSKKWVELFEVTRDRFQNEISDIPIANKAYRLRTLDRMAARAEAMRNYNLTAQLIEQAAKECGDSYTNKQKHEHSGAGGGPIETLTLSKDEYKQARREMLEDDDC